MTWHFAISRHGSMTQLNGSKRLLYVVRSKTLFTVHPFNLYVVDYHHLLILFSCLFQRLVFCFKPDIGESSRTGSNLQFPEVPPLKQTSAEWFWTGLDEFGLPRPPAFQYWFLEYHPGWWLITLVIIEFPGWSDDPMESKFGKHLTILDSNFLTGRISEFPGFFVGDAISPNRLFTTPP